MGFLGAQLERSIDFTADPATVAASCQASLAAIGLKIKEVSRETGLITARSPVFTLGGDKAVTIQIARESEKTKVNISVAAQAGLQSDRQARKLLADFLTDLAARPELAGASKAGW